MYIDVKYRYAVAYCMGHIVEQESDEFKAEWNAHTIRANSKSLLPSCIPNDMYDMPQTYGQC